mgnify:CR=1 FL=1
MPQWPGDDQPLAIHRRSEHGADSHMSRSIEFGCHIGTHIDAPLHFLANAPAVDSMALDRFIGPALVIRCGDGDTAAAIGPEVLAGHDLAGVDFVLFDTGWDRHWGSDRYYREWSWLSPALAEELAAALAGHAPDGIDRFYFLSGGGEAVEAAIKMARQIHLANGRPEKFRLVARWKSYHGLTLGVNAYLLYQVSNGSMTGDDSAFGGIYRLQGGWTALGRGTDHPGRLEWRIENRSEAFSQLAQTWRSPSVKVTSTARSP